MLTNREASSSLCRHDWRALCGPCAHHVQVKSRQLWGDEVYTDDSDVVAVLLHLGYYASSNVTCNPLISRFYAQINLLPPQEQYLSATRNAVRSRCWFAKTEGCSFQVRLGVVCWCFARGQGCCC